MSRKLRLLDAFCCAGGAGVGYDRAGFEVTGIDIAAQPNYPFAFIQGDAIEYIAKHGHEYDAIHSSPPCQSSTALTKGTNRTTRAHLHTDLIPATRQALAKVGRPSIIENVQGAAVRKDLVLCGEMFSLGVIRHRYFEVEGFEVTQPAHIPHRGRVRGWRHGVMHEGPYVSVYGAGGQKGTVAQWQEAMGGINWTDVRKEIAEMIPPVFSEFVGSQLMAHLTAQAA